MDYCIAKPSLLLSKFVKHYWTIENCNPTQQKHIQRIVPNGLLELIFYMGNRPVSIDKTKSINENTVVTGHLSGFYDLQVTGSLTLFSILFKPNGLSMFFDIPLNELYNQNVPLKYLFKSDTEALENRLYETNSFQGRIKIIENFLLQRLQKNTNKNNYHRIEHCIEIINESKGIVDIDFLASEACFSRKQFERVFLNYIGTTPKKFLKTIRFQNVIDKKSKARSTNLSELTYSCGYYDQSHMISDFQKLAGMTPKQYFKECEPYSDYFQ